LALQRTDEKEIVRVDTCRRKCFGNWLFSVSRETAERLSYAAPANGTVNLGALSFDGCSANCTIDVIWQ
jgi:hypothetical protein